MRASLPVGRVSVVPGPAHVWIPLSLPHFGGVEGLVSRASVGHSHPLLLTPWGMGSRQGWHRPHLPFLVSPLPVLSVPGQLVAQATAVLAVDINVPTFLLSVEDFQVEHLELEAT